MSSSIQTERWLTVSVRKRGQTIGNSIKELSWSASGDSWIHVSGSSVSYDENPTKEIRSGSVTLTQAESGKTLTLTVRQKGKTSIDINP